MNTRGKGKFRSESKQTLIFRFFNVNFLFGGNYNHSITQNAAKTNQDSYTMKLEVTNCDLKNN